MDCQNLVSRTNHLAQNQALAALFGLQKGGADPYRFGFNRQMKDNEIKGLGNSLDFGARMYDSRIGRFSSLDPFLKRYPDLSSYSFVNNTPIRNKEIEGKYWLDFNVCNYSFKHKEHGGNYTMITKVDYKYTSIVALKGLNLATAMPFSPEISWTATVAKIGLAINDNSVSFGLNDWAGIALNVVGAGAAKYANNNGKTALELYKTTISLTGEQLQAFKSSDYYQVYLDNEAGKIMKKDGIITEEGFSQSLLKTWHDQGVKKVKSKDNAFMKKYKVGKSFGGVSEKGAPAEYVKDKVKETIEAARSQAAQELESKLNQ